MADKKTPSNDLRFSVCERGFVLMDGDRMGMIPTMYAFDRIEDVAAWLIRNFRSDECGCNHCTDCYRRIAEIAEKRRS